MFNKYFNNKFIIFLMGPTASGKSDLAIQLRGYLPIELVSVDSALIYKYMDIGTAKPSYLQLLSHPIGLVSIIDPTDYYSVINFRNDVLKLIKKIFSMNKIPLLVGGTMFYYYVLLNGISKFPQSNLLLRKNFLNYKNIYKNNFLYEKLYKIDADTARKIHPHDTYRIIRALEVYYNSGQIMSVLKHKKFSSIPYNILQFAIVPDKEQLLNSIKNRFYHMLDIGFQREVEYLFNRGDLNINFPSMRCIGYNQMWLYLLNKITYQEMIHDTIKSTYQLSKRQMTWLKNWKNVYFLHDKDTEILKKNIIKIVTNRYYQD